MVLSGRPDSAPFFCQHHRCLPQSLTHATHRAAGVVELYSIRPLQLQATVTSMPCQTSTNSPCYRRPRRCRPRGTGLAVDYQVQTYPHVQPHKLHTFTHDGNRQHQTKVTQSPPPSSPQTVGDDSGPCLPVHPIPVRFSIRFLHPSRSEPVQVSHGCPLPGTLRGTPQCGRWLDHACPRSRASGIPELRRQTPITSPAMSYTDGARVTGNAMDTRCCPRALGRI